MIFILNDPIKSYFCADILVPFIRATTFRHCDDLAQTVETKGLRRTGMKRRLSYSSSVANMSHLPLDAGCNNGIATSDGALGQQLHQSVEVKNSTAGGKSTAVARRPLRQRVICGRCSRPSSMSWIAVIGLVLVSRASLFTVAGSPASASDPPPTSRLCAPPESARAYVTTLADEETVGQGLSVRVLAQSLRSAGAKGDIIVLVPLDRSHGKTVDSFRRDGLTVHTVPRGLQTGENSN